jgi:hypothetical protein
MENGSNITHSPKQLLTDDPKIYSDVDAVPIIYFSEKLSNEANIFGSR